MQIRVQQESLPQPEILTKLVENHPFTHQLDVVLTASEVSGLVQLLSPLQTSYHRAKLTFAAVFSHESGITALSVGSLATEDVWCIDFRRILTLSLTKQSYENLGILGSPVGRPRRKDRFAVTLDLNDTTSRLAAQARHLLLRWDVRRAETGADGWEVLLSSSLPSAPYVALKRDIVPLVQTISGLWIPPEGFPLIDSESAQEDLSSLFEWVGLASLGSQRLFSNDAVNPYVASYEPPAGCRVGSVTHFRWTGLLAPAFVQSILNAVLPNSESLLAITATSFDSPVSHVSTSSTTKYGDNVWTLVVSGAGTQGAARVGPYWVLAETNK